MSPHVASGSLTQQVAVEDLIIELLADLLGEDAGQLRTSLQQKGGNMPVDSLDLFDILAEFRMRTQLSLPVRKLKRDTLRSVESFAKFVVNEATV